MVVVVVAAVVVVAVAVMVKYRGIKYQNIGEK